MKQVNIAKWMMLIAALFFLAACGGSGSGSASFTTDGTGTLSLSMIDASDATYKAVYVSIKEVQVCRDAGSDQGEGDDAECEWETIVTLNKTYNLLELVNGVMVTLGQKDLEPGTYNQMRMLLWDGQEENSQNILGYDHPFPQYLIDLNDVAHEMKVPSGYQSGIKLVRQFEIEENLTTELILDFDVLRSVIKAGNSGKYILKPTIKVIGTHNRAVVSGEITDNVSGDPLAGARVSVWDEGLRLAASAIADENGTYMFYLDLGGAYALDPKDYLLVATATGHAPGCDNLTAEVDQTYSDIDFALSPVETVTVSGTVTGTIADSLPAGEVAPTVHISFKQVGNCSPDPVEVAFTDIQDETDYDAADTGEFSYAYSIDLPAGTYNVTASTEGFSETKEDSDLTDDTTLDFDL